MAENPPGSNEPGGRGDAVAGTLFLIGVGAAIAAIALPQARRYGTESVADGLAGIAAALVSAGAFIAFALARAR